MLRESIDEVGPPLAERVPIPALHRHQDETVPGRRGHVGRGEARPLERVLRFREAVQGERGQARAEPVRRLLRRRGRGEAELSLGLVVVGELVVGDRERPARERLRRQVRDARRERLEGLDGVSVGLRAQGQDAPVEEERVGIAEPRRRRGDASERLQRLGLPPLAERDVGDGEEGERLGLEIRLRRGLAPLADRALGDTVPEERPPQGQARARGQRRVRIVAERRPQHGGGPVRVVPARGALGDEQERPFPQLGQDARAQEGLSLAARGRRVVLAERNQTQAVGRPLGDGLLAALVPELAVVILRLEEPAFVLELLAQAVPHVLLRRGRQREQQDLAVDVGRLVLGAAGLGGVGDEEERGRDEGIPRGFRLQLARRGRCPAGVPDSEIRAHEPRADLGPELRPRIGRIGLEEALDGHIARVPLERDPARLHEGIPPERMVDRRGGRELVQEIEGAVGITQPGQRDAAPELELRQDRARGPALDDLVPEGHRFGGAILQEPGDAEQIAGHERERLRRRGVERALQ